VWATTGTMLSNNTAAGAGGAIDCHECQSLLIASGAEVRSNAANTTGGGVNCEDCGEIVLNGTLLAGNIAAKGGGLNAESTTALTLCVLTNTSVVGNTATGSAPTRANDASVGYDTILGTGGGVRLLGGHAVLADCNFGANTAGMFGSAVFATSRTVQLPPTSRTQQAAQLVPTAAAFRSNFRTSSLPLYEQFGAFAANGADRVADVAAYVLKSDKGLVRRLAPLGWQAAANLNASLFAFTPSTLRSMLLGSAQAGGASGRNTSALFATDKATLSSCTAYSGDPPVNATADTLLAGIIDAAFGGGGNSSGGGAACSVIGANWTQMLSTQLELEPQDTRKLGTFLSASPRALQINGSAEYLLADYSSNSVMPVLQLLLLDDAGRAADHYVPNSLVQANTTAVNSSQLLLVGTTAVYVSNGVANFSGLILRAKPGTSHQVLFLMPSYIQVRNGRGSMHMWNNPVTRLSYYHPANLCSANSSLAQCSIEVTSRLPRSALTARVKHAVVSGDTQCLSSAFAPRQF
jgi:hypothetical protein